MGNRESGEVHGPRMHKYKDGECCVGCGWGARAFNSAHFHEYDGDLGALVAAWKRLTPEEHSPYQSIGEVMKQRRRKKGRAILQIRE